jgi:hypothetical protein
LPTAAASCYDAGRWVGPRARRARPTLLRRTTGGCRSARRAARPGVVRTARPRAVDEVVTPRPRRMNALAGHGGDALPPRLPRAAPFSSGSRATSTPPRLLPGGWRRSARLGERAAGRAFRQRCPGATWEKHRTGRCAIVATAVGGFPRAGLVLGVARGRREGYYLSIIGGGTTSNVVRRLVGLRWTACARPSATRGRADYSRAALEVSGEPKGGTS